MGEMNANRRRISVKWINRIIEQIDNATELEEVSRIVLKVKQCVEADNTLFALMVPVSLVEPRISLLTDYPKTWLQRYREQKYVDLDPVLAAAKNSTLPIIWSEQENLSDSASRMMQDAASHGLQDGITFSVRGARGEFGLFSLAYRQTQRKLRSRLGYLSPYLQLLTNHLHTAAVRTWREAHANQTFANPAPHNHRLNPRELECLLWVAEGKTTWEIGKILMISESTVNAHITSASHKLNANNRSHAVVRALSEGYIRPTLKLSEYVQIHPAQAHD